MVRLHVKIRVSAAMVVVAGVVLTAVGVAAIYWPAGLIVAGFGAVLYGLFLIDDGRRVNEPVAARRRPPG